jgi:uncharacterized protein (DUF1330 family)
MSAYLISQVGVLDPEAWENCRTRAAPAIAQFGGRYLVRGALAMSSRPTGPPMSRRHKP